MPDVRAFRSCRFREDLEVDWSHIFAPPYDVINKHERERLLASHPYNVVRLILPSTHQESREIIRNWLDREILTVDEVPSIFLVRESFEFMDTIYTRWGIMCTMKLEPFDSGVIIPHEMTIKKHKEDRMALMKAVKGNLSPVFVLFEGDGSEILHLFSDENKKLLYSFKLRDKAVRTVFRITDETVIETVRNALAGRRLLIADGHHRYETALEYSLKYSSGDNDPAQFVLVYLVPAESMGVQVFPTHRVVEFNIKGERIVDEIARKFEVKESEIPTNGELLKLPSNVFFIVMDGRCWRVNVNEKNDFKGVLPEMAQINSVVVEKFVLEEILGYKSAGERGLVEYYHTVEETVAHLKRSPNATAFILSPVKVEEVFNISSKGVRFPPKTTYFHPKIPSGLCFHLFEYQNYS